jgi:hypothetical protein
MEIVAAGYAWEFSWIILNVFAVVLLLVTLKNL